jgi:hypothetical protein
MIMPRATFALVKKQNFSAVKLGIVNPKLMPPTLWIL